MNVHFHYDFFYFLVHHLGFFLILFVYTSLRTRASRQKWNWLFYFESNSHDCSKTLYPRHTIVFNSLVHSGLSCRLLPLLLTPTVFYLHLACLCHPLDYSTHPKNLFLPSSTLETTFDFLNLDLRTIKWLFFDSLSKWFFQ